jgi:succinate dehydrogenase / fumarate reductase, cytochrome b subunit
MSWFTETFTSSIGRKLLMSLTGIFLIMFLVIHLMGNLAVFKEDGGEAFNAYSAFMSTNVLIKSVSYGLYLSILAHSVIAAWLWISNKKARPAGYAVLNANENSTWASRSMMLLGSLVLIFIVIHLKDFWWQFKMGGTTDFEIDTLGNKNLYALVVAQFKSPATLVIYLIGLIALAIHLWHGFQSAFQTLGIEHERYTPAIRFLGKLYAVFIPAGFAAMPVYIFFFK